MVTQLVKKYPAYYGTQSLYCVHLCHMNTPQSRGEEKQMFFVSIILLSIYLFLTSLVYGYVT